jgi:hypothetical protein
MNKWKDGYVGGLGCVGRQRNGWMDGWMDGGIKTERDRKINI